jgi:diguanylate cyclase (GGDEF)-like protein
MARPSQNLSPPATGLLRWLVYPGPDVPEEVRGLLLSRMFAGPIPVVMAVINTVLVSGVALAMTGGPVFVFYTVADILLGSFRVGVIRRMSRALASGGKPRMNAYLISGIITCALQGALAMTGMLTGRPALQILSTITVFGIIGPVCARNYPAPRYCMALVMLCDLPFVAGCVLLGNHWLLITLAETPPFLLATYEVIRTFQRLATETLQAAVEGRHRATHDSLTGLLNRRGFQEAIAHHAGRPAPSLGVLALDLDGFKAVNDVFGHHVGDALLEAVAGRLAGRVRPADQVIRLGGDEFVVLLSHGGFAEASKLADRLIEDIGHVPYRIGGAAMVRVGISIGISCAPEDGTDIERLHRGADLALYEAKTAGRGVWRRFDRSMETESFYTQQDEPLQTHPQRAHDRLMPL